jgi:hypothetical protein
MIAEACYDDILSRVGRAVLTYPDMTPAIAEEVRVLLVAKLDPCPHGHNLTRMICPHGCRSTLRRRP